MLFSEAILIDELIEGRYLNCKDKKKYKVRISEITHYDVEIVADNETQAAYIAKKLRNIFPKVMSAQNEEDIAVKRIDQTLKDKIKREFSRF